MWRQSYRCIQIDGKQRAFLGHARDRQSPVDLANLERDISMPYRPQDEPTDTGRELMANDTPT
jgi:hypothetical protein